MYYEERYVRCGCIQLFYAIIPACFLTLCCSAIPTSHTFYTCICTSSFAHFTRSLSYFPLVRLHVRPLIYKY